MADHGTNRRRSHYARKLARKNKVARDSHKAAGVKVRAAWKKYWMGTHMKPIVEISFIGPLWQVKIHQERTIPGGGE